MKAFKIGESTNRQSIEVLASSDNIKSKRIMIMSGLHGDEIEGVVLSSMILNRCGHGELDLLKEAVFLPLANPDGFTLNQRWNVNKVDLNRNWPTKDWSPVITNPRYPPGPYAGSEAETLVLKEFLEESKIEFVIDLHSFKDSVLLPLFHQTPLALQKTLNQLSEDLKIPIEYEQDNLGYSISGGFHTWCYEKKIQNLTIEVEKGIGQFAIRERYLEPLISFLKALS